MRKKLTLFILFLLAGFTAALAQSTVRGKVTDKRGESLPGVSVLVKGTTTGTVTDANGNYSINAASNATLTFSFIGFSTQNASVDGRTNIDITLSDDTRSLDEVVVIGFGAQKKSVVTGAIASVKSRDFADQQVTNITDVLKGRTSGVSVTQGSGAPGSTGTIRVRGITSINNSDPLYVVDGTAILNGGIENINPYDIESIEVLKDASAAIYGSRASTGVILVTTKKGKVGATQLSYNGYVGFQNPVTRYKLANATQYATLRNQAVVNDGGTAPFANPAQYGEGTNWQDVIFKGNAIVQNHGLNISGGTDKASYYTSFGYYNQQGIIFKDISNYKRYNFTVNTSFKPKKWLNIGENLQYSYNQSQGGVNTNSEFGGPLSSALNLDPITPVVVTGAVPSTGYNSPYIIRDAQGRPYGISQYVQNEITNPLAFLQTVRGNYGWSHNLFGNAFVEIMPISGLKFRSQISGKQSFYGDQSFSPLYYLNTLVNNSTNVNANRGSNRNFTWNWDNTLSYEKKVGLHHFTALVGTSAQEEQGVTMGITYNNLPISGFITSPNQLSLNYTLPTANRLGSTGDQQPYHVSSYFSRLIYDYNEKYLFTGIFRHDGSSKFGPNNVYGNFPAVELGWVASKEDFFPKSSALSYLKFRGSYGAVGNEQSLGYFFYEPIISSGRNYVFGNDQLTIGNSPAAPANPDLKWESVNTADIGFDAVLFDNFNLTVDVYRKTTKGMLQNVPLPGYAGFDADYRANVGNLENKGIELELGYNKNFGPLHVTLNGNIAYNKNTVTYLGVTPFYDNGNFQSTSFAIYRTQVGQPVNSFFGFQNLGVFHSQAEIDAYTQGGAKIQPNAKPGDFKWQDTNGDGKIDQADRVFQGSQLPTWTYGVNLGAEYKGFDFKVFGQGVWGNKLYQGYRRLDIAGANYSVDALNAWTPANPTSNYPRLTVADPNHNFSYPSNFNLQSGAYFRIKTAQIGYTIPKNLLSKIDVNRVRIYVSSNNLATITKYNGFDPEIQGGIDRGIYPQSRSFLLGLDITL